MYYIQPCGCQTNKMRVLICKKQHLAYNFSYTGTAALVGDGRKPVLLLYGVTIFSRAVINLVFQALGELNGLIFMLLICGLL
jgi:hypothetical protein